jgi:hypothetical protein
MNADEFELFRSLYQNCRQLRFYHRLIQFRLIYPEVFGFKGIKQIGLRSTLKTFRAARLWTITIRS